MKPPPFRYHTPQSLTEALGLLQDFQGRAKVLAGGQSLVPLLNLRLAYPEVLIDLNRIAGLAYIRKSDSHVLIGTMTRQREAEFSELLATECPIVVEALSQVGHPAIRNRGTVGGSLAHADPVAELPCIMTALDAEFVVVKRGAERSIEAKAFYVGPYETALQDGEILREIRIPTRRRLLGASFVEFSRRHGDFALAEAAVLLHGDEDADRCARATVVVASPVMTPSALSGVETLIVQAGLTKTDDRGFLEDVEQLVADAVGPLESDAGATDYERHLIAVLVRRATEKALQQWSRS